MADQPPTVPGRNLIFAIVAAMIVWGLYLAFGAGTQSPTGLTPQRGAVVAIFVLGFVGFWLGMMWWRNRSQK